MIYTAFGCSVGMVVSMAVFNVGFLPAAICAAIAFVVVSFLFEGL